MSRPAIIRFQKSVGLSVSGPYLHYQEVLHALTRNCLGVDERDLPENVQRRIRNYLARQRARSEAAVKANEVLRERFNFQAVKLAGSDGQNLTMAHLYATRLLQAAIRGFIERKRKKELEDRLRKERNERRAREALEYVYVRRCRTLSQKQNPCVHAAFLRFPHLSAYSAARSSPLTRAWLTILCPRVRRRTSWRRIRAPRSRWRCRS